MNRLGLHRFVLCVAAAATVAAPAWLGCKGDDSSGATTTPESGTFDPETGTPPGTDGSTDLDAAACGKLPASGLGTVLPVKDGSEQGKGAVMTLDKKGRPLFAYLDRPNGAVASLYVVRWDDCLGTWRAPQKIDDSITDHTSGFRLVGIATDASDGRIGITYERDLQLVAGQGNDSSVAYVALSPDDGATFTTGKVSHHRVQDDGGGAGDGNNIDNPTIALAGGKTFIAYNQEGTACGPDGSGCWLAPVLATATGMSTTFTYEIAKDSSDTTHGGTINAAGFPMGLAVDSDGVPGLVVHIEPQSAYNLTVGYWRPGQATYTKLYDSNNNQNDDGAATLAYDGKKPRVVTRLQRGPTGAATTYNLLFSASDDGVTWADPVAFALTGSIPASERILAPSGKVVVLTGGPDVFRSTDLKTFAQDAPVDDDHSVSVSGAIGADGKLWVGFEGTTPANDQAVGGIVLFRE